MLKLPSRKDLTCLDLERSNLEVVAREPKENPATHETRDFRSSSAELGEPIPALYSHCHRNNNSMLQKPMSVIGRRGRDGLRGGRF